MSRVLVIGASGFIGHHLVRHLNGTKDHVVEATFRSQTPPDDGNSWHRLDLTDPAGLEQVFRSARPEAVVHLAAMADVMTAEREPERTTAVNVTATSSIARLCQRHGARLVFMSTEYVFDGGRGNYREDETPNPTTHYGLTKFQAEQQVADIASRWSILRTSIVYGWPHPEKRNFVPWLADRLRSGQPYHAPTDVFRTPVYIGHLVEGVVKLLEGEHIGVRHIAGRDWVSMYDFALAIAGAFHLDPGLVVPVQPAESPGGDLLGLDCARTMRCLGLSQPGLVDGLRAMLDAAKR